MEKNIDYVKELLQKKKKQDLNAEDLEKVEALEVIFSHNNPFFDLDMETALEILYFLEVPSEKVEELYFSLISPQAFKDSSSQYQMNLK